MEQVNLTGTGLTVSRICLGTMTFGDQLNEEDSINLLKRAVEKGINFIDTADIYVHGVSETITGKALQGMRDEIVLASKVGGPSEKGLNGKGLNRKHMIRSVENSLQRLGTDYLDILYLHFPDPQTPIEEALECANQLIQAGKVRYFGMSNYSAWQMMEALAVCDKRNWIAPSITESVYNVVTRGVESELVPFIKEKKMGLAIFNPIAGGLLSGKHKKDKPAENSRFSDLGGYYKRYWNDDSFSAIARLEKIAGEYGISLLELSLRWCVSYDYVSSVIIGVSRMEHLEQNLSYLERGALEEEVLEKCDDVWQMLNGNRFSYYH